MDEFNKDLNQTNAEQQSAENQTENQPDVENQVESQVENPVETEFDGQYQPEYQNQSQPVADDSSTIWNKVEYTPVNPVSNYKPMSKGLKLFCFIMAAVIILTGTCAVGYFAGRGSVNYVGKQVDVNLASKPKNTDQSTPAQIYNQVNESVVGIRVYSDAGNASDASGVIYTEDGYIVTNDHIYSEIPSAKFKVYMYDGTEYDAVYVAGDTVSDLAVLKIDAKNLKPAELGNSNELICGEEVVAIGRPSDATDKSSITSGIISLTKRRVKTTSSYTARLIQTDSAINPGSSGGALVNMYGQVVGITSSKLAGVEYDAIGYAIPTTTVKRIVEQLISDGKVTDRAKLGITYTEINSVTAEINNYSDTGLMVVSVSEDSDAYGEIGEGDLITHVNGQEITNDDIILDVIEDSKAGDIISLTVLTKEGDTEELEVQLKANVSDSSYSSSDGTSQSSGENGFSNGIFNFPQGD